MAEPRRFKEGDLVRATDAAATLWEHNNHAIRGRIGTVEDVYTTLNGDLVAFPYEVEWGYNETLPMGADELEAV